MNKSAILIVVLLAGCGAPEVSFSTSSCNAHDFSACPVDGGSVGCGKRIRLACVERVDITACGPWTPTEQRRTVGHLPGNPMQAAQDSDWYVVASALQEGSALLAFHEGSGVSLQQSAGGIEFFLSKNEVLYSDPSGDLSVWHLVNNLTQPLHLVNYKPLGLQDGVLLAHTPNNDTLLILNLESGNRNTVYLRSLPEWSPRMNLVDATLAGTELRIAANESYRYEEEGIWYLFTQIMTYRLKAPYTQAEWTALEFPFQDIVMTQGDMVVEAGPEPVVYRGDKQFMFPADAENEHLLPSLSDTETRVTLATSVSGDRFALIHVENATNQEVGVWDSLHTCYRLLLKDSSPGPRGLALSGEGDLIYLEEVGPVHELVRLSWSRH